MRRLIICLVFFSLLSCEYKKSKATYSIIDVDTIAIDHKVLEKDQEKY